MRTIETITELETLYGTPGTNSLVKVAPGITPEYQRLIESSPFCLIASSGPEGLDCSPRGDSPGFIRIIDEQTLAIPDRRGNNRLDTLRNIVRNGQISLLFLIPGLNETLRINGTATVTTDTELAESFAIDGKQPVTIIMVKTNEVYFQCARALIRSGLWNPDNHVDRATLPTAGQMTRSALEDNGAELEFDAEAYDLELPGRQRKTLY